MVILVYTAIMACGILVGARFRRIPAESVKRRRLQQVSLFILLFVLGHQLGSDETVLLSLSKMGLLGLLITLIAMTGSFAAVYLIRRLTEPKNRGEQL